MKRVCAWCKKLLDDATQDNAEPLLVTHGICFDCVEKLNPNARVRLAEFLDTLEAPVVMVDDARQETHANALARRPLPQQRRTKAPLLTPISLPPLSASSLSSTPPSEIYECVASAEPDGCDRQLHCAGCTIRRAVLKTFVTGEPLVRIPACQSRDTPDELARASYWVSTQLVDDLVLVQITTKQY